MNEVFKGVLIALIPSLIVAVVTAKLTVDLSIRQFRTQKWWGNKYETYSKVVACLSRLQYCYREWTKAFDGENPAEWTEADRQRISAKFRAAMEEFQETANASAFTISAKVAEEIMRLRDELDDASGLPERREDACEKHELIENSIRDIRIYSREDLQE